MTSRTSNYRSHFFVLALYSLLALVLTYPLALNFFSAVPGVEGDLWSYVWTLGWAKTAFTLGVNPFHNDYIFYPLGGATQFFWALSLIGVVSIPLQNFFGLVPTYNLLYLTTTIFTAYGTFLLADEIVANKFAAFVAGLVFAFGALRQGYGLAFLNLYNTELIPFYALFLIRTLRRESKWNPISAGILLGLNAYIDFQLLTFLALFTLLFIVGDYIGAPLLTYLRTHALRLLLLAFVAFVVMMPMLLAVQNEFAIEGGDYIRVYPLRYSNARAYDILSYVIPNARSTLYQALPSIRVAGVNSAVSVEGESQLSPDRQAFLGYVTLALGVGAFVWNRKRARVWAFVAFAFAVFSFGPYLHIGGADTGVPLPFIALHEIPIVDHIRVPMRYGLFVLFPIAILASIGLDELQKKIFHHRGAENKEKNIFRRVFVSWWLVPVPISILILAEYAVLPYPLQNFSPSAFYTRIANEPGAFTILEIPSYDWRDAAKEEAYQAIHHKRILRAYTNRIAPDLADYFSLRQTPIVVRSLRILEGAEAGTLTADEIAEDRANANAVLNFYDLKYAVVHHDLLTAEQDAAIQNYLRGVLNARVVTSDANATLYTFDSAPAKSTTALTIDTATNIGLMYLGRGWQTEPPAQLDDVEARYVKGAFAEIYFPGEGTTRTLILRAVCPASPARVALQLNDHSLSSPTIGSEWQDYRFDLSNAVKSGMNHLTLRFDSPQNENCALKEITTQ